MLGRRSTSDDAVAAARRRLAALAGQFERERSLRATSSGPDVAESTEPAADGQPGPAALSADSDRAGATAGQGMHRSRPGAPYGQWGLTAHHVTIAALVVVAVMAVAAWWVLRSIPEPAVQLSSDRVAPDSGPRDPLTAGAPSVPTPTGGAPAPQGAGVPLVIDVTGKVRQPGIVELPTGSRVIDALHAAGGTRPGVDTSSLNLARLLVDGEQIVVGLDVPSVSTSTGPDDPGGDLITPVNLNTATADQLDTLPGVGPVTAEAILAWRADNGAFSTVAELLEVSGIGDATLADLEPYVYV